MVKIKNKQEKTRKKGGVIICFFCFLFCSFFFFFGMWVLYCVLNACHHYPKHNYTLAQQSFNQNLAKLNKCKSKKHTNHKLIYITKKPNKTKQQNKNKKTTKNTTIGDRSLIGNQQVTKLQNCAKSVL